MKKTLAQTLFKNPCMSDITLNSHEFTIPCHKIVLCGKSEFFKNFFSHEFQDSQAGEIHLDDVESKEIFEEFVSYLYDYKVEITKKNVVPLLILSDKHLMTDLRQECIAFIAQNLGSLIKEILTLPFAFVEEIWKHDHFSIQEEHVSFEILYQWMIECNPNMNLLNSCLQLVAFSKVPVDKLVTLGAGTPLEQNQLLKCVLWEAVKAQNGLPLKNEMIRPKIFTDSSLLTRQFEFQINDWIGVEKTSKWSLLYKATGDSFSKSKFLELCSMKSPTVMVIKSSKSGHIFGGYTPCYWVDKCRSFDPKSFIFSLLNKTQGLYRFPHRSDATESISMESGPRFGPDITIKDVFRYAHYGKKYMINTHTSSLGSQYHFDPKIMGFTPGFSESKTFLAGDAVFTAVEIEVFTPSEPAN